MSKVIEYKCPNCGGAVVFNSATQLMHCSFCNTDISAAALQDYDEILNTEAPDRLEWEMDEEEKAQWSEEEAMGMNVYLCESCSGEIIADETTAATTCPYCGNPVVLTNKLSGDIRPDCIIPFKLGKNVAKDALKKHLRGKILLPKVFKTENHIDEVKGVYVPFWLFEAEAEATINFRAIKTRRRKKGLDVYMENRFYSIRRKGIVRFDNVPVDGSSQMPDDLMESIEPYDFSEAKEFHTAYLSGYLADRYDVPSERYNGRIRERVEQTTYEIIKSTVEGYSEVKPLSSNILVNGGKVKYALLPVWLLHTSWRGQHFLFAMNGQTGKLVGNLPMDKGAYWRWFFAIGFAVGLLAYILLQFAV